MAAKAKWQEERARLLSLKGQIDAELRRLEEARQICLQLSQARQNAIKQQTIITELAARQSELAANFARHNANLDRARAEHARRVDELRRHHTRDRAFSRASYEPRNITDKSAPVLAHTRT
jgi:hypothetical protein